MFNDDYKEKDQHQTELASLKKDEKNDMTIMIIKPSKLLTDDCNSVKDE